MKLNPDCIRDILLTAEEICEFDTPWKHDKEQSIGERLEKYPYDEILYHLHQAGKSGLLENVHIYDDMGAFLLMMSHLPVMSSWLISAPILSGIVSKLLVQK